jgi:hypothetical protein
VYWGGGGGAELNGHLRNSRGICLPVFFSRSLDRTVVILVFENRVKEEGAGDISRNMHNEKLLSLFPSWRVR